MEFFQNHVETVVYSMFSFQKCVQTVVYSVFSFQKYEKTVVYSNFSKLLAVQTAVYSMFSKLLGIQTAVYSFLWKFLAVATCAAIYRRRPSALFIVMLVNTHVDLSQNLSTNLPKNRTRRIIRVRFYDNLAGNRMNRRLFTENLFQFLP